MFFVVGDVTSVLHSHHDWLMFLVAVGKFRRIILDFKSFAILQSEIFEFRLEFFVPLQQISKYLLFFLCKIRCTKTDLVTS